MAVAVENQEPVLLVGETGTGKTHSVQYLAEMTGNSFSFLELQVMLLFTNVYRNRNS